MVRLDGTYGNICRISFDGNHRASIGLLRDGVYGTDWRITDMFFSNLATGIQYGGTSDQGQDLTAIMRCRFSRCGTGLKMTNQNCMGIYAWYCLFEDCRTAIDNGGGFAMPMCSVFLRSAVVDITTGQNGYPVLNNTSVGSKMFLDNSQSQWCMVMANNNKVYNATDTTVMKNVDVALDNTILSRSGSGPVFSSGKPNFVCVGNTFTIPNPVQAAARSCILEQKIVDASTLAVPSAIRLPGTPRNNHRKIFEIQKNAGDVAAEIQSKITAASSRTGRQQPGRSFSQGRVQPQEYHCYSSQSRHAVGRRWRRSRRRRSEHFVERERHGPLFQALRTDAGDHKRNLLCSCRSERGFDDGGKCRPARRPHLLRPGGAHGQY